MSESHGKYTLQMHLTPDWDGRRVHSAIGLVTDEYQATAARFALRGPFSDFQEAREATLQRFHEIAAMLEQNATGKPVTALARDHRTQETAA